MQKGCRALLIDKLGRLLAAASDGCCYLLDAESLHQDARLILHPSQTGVPSPLLVLHSEPVCNCTCRKFVVQALEFCNFKVVEGCGVLQFCTFVSIAECSIVFT